jgi:hypothetical protein
MCGPLPTSTYICEHQIKIDHYNNILGRKTFPTAEPIYNPWWNITRNVGTINCADLKQSSSAIPIPINFWMKKIDIRDWLQTLQSEEEPALRPLLKTAPANWSVRLPLVKLETTTRATGWRLWCVQTEIWLDLWRCWRKNRMGCWGTWRYGQGKSGAHCGSSLFRAPFLPRERDLPLKANW